VEIWLALIGLMGALVGSVLGPIVVARLNKPASTADTANKWATANSISTETITKLMDRVRVLEEDREKDIIEREEDRKQIAALGRTIVRLRCWASNVITAFNVVTAQLRELGQEPRATIPEVPGEDPNQ
jgi:hypothetical protein